MKNKIKTYFTFPTQLTHGVKKVISYITRNLNILMESYTVVTVAIIFNGPRKAKVIVENNVNRSIFSNILDKPQN